MHIPKCETAALNIPPFHVALKEALLPKEDYDREKWLYVPCQYDEYRYILGTIGKNPLLCIGINPSTAKPDALDNTLKSVERIASFNGYDSFLMMNLYAQRATDPDSMEKKPNFYLHQQNIEAFSYILSFMKRPAIWASWGAIIEKRDYLSDFVTDFSKIAGENAQWLHCGALSKKGHPHHPLYLKKDSLLCPFDIQNYVKNVLNKNF